MREWSLSVVRLVLLGIVGVLVPPAAAADAPVPPAPAPALPLPPPADAAPPDPAAAKEQAAALAKEQMRLAEVKARQAEIEFLKAKIELRQLKAQEEIARLQAQLQAAEAALMAAGGGPPTAAEQGFIRTWLVLGPIKVDAAVDNHDETSCKTIFDRTYVTAGATPRAGAEGLIAGSAGLTWTAAAPAEAADFAVDLAKVAADANRDPEHAVFLGVVYVTSEAEQTGVKLLTGSDDDCAWRLNGTEVIRTYAGRAVDRDQDASGEVTLKAGVNVLSFTVINGGGGAAAAARFVDKDGNPVKGLTASLEPPAK